ncbi:MAG: hypothetical protein WC430_03780 [Patescibacteria group bacterium]
MHFKITTDNLISDFHIEDWDSKSLGQEMIKMIQNYKNKNYEEFIIFALKNRLFLKLRSLFLLNKEESIYFWNCAPIYGETEKEGLKMLLRLDPERKQNIKYAKFYLTGSQEIESKMISVFYENGVSQLLGDAGYQAKEIMFEIDENEIKEISLDFNISRNNINGVYILVKKDGDNEELMGGTSSKIMFVGLKEETNELDILTEDYVKNISSGEMKKYIGFIPTYTNDEKKQNELIEILTKIKKMKKKWWKF